MIIHSGGIQPGEVPGSDGNRGRQSRLSFCVDTHTHTQSVPLSELSEGESQTREETFMEEVRRNL